MVFLALFLNMMYKAHNMENKDQKNLLIMAVAGIGLYLFFKKKSTTAPVVPPTTGGGGELLPIAPNPVYQTPVEPIYQMPIYQPEPSPINVLPIFTNPISDLINLIPVQPVTPAPIYQAPVQPAPAPVYQAPTPTPVPIYEAPVQPSPGGGGGDIFNPPVYNEPIYNPEPIYQTPVYQPEPIYYEPAPVIAEPTPVFNEPIPVTGGGGGETYNTPSYNDPSSSSNYIPELIGGGNGGLYTFLSNQVWLQNLTSFQMESYMAEDMVNSRLQDQA
jgi:hypothetical protein